MRPVNDHDSDPTIDPERDPERDPDLDDNYPGQDAPRDETTRRQNRVAAIGLVALAVALAFGAGIAVGRATAPSGPVVPTQAADLPSDGARLGRADAKVVIEYWADYQCPFCARFASDIIPQLKSRIADGTIALVHRDFAFLGDESVDAAVAVRCAGREGKYWTMHDAVYSAQQGENQGAFARAGLQRIAAAVGVDPAAFIACLDERAPLVDVLDDTAAGVRSGIASTPTIDVNGTRYLGVPDVAKLLATIDAAVAGASPAPLPTPAPSQEPWSGTTTDGRAAGDPAAPVTVELWMDYQAPGSAAIAKDLEPELRKRIATGAINANLRDLATLGDESVIAASAVRCVAQQKGPAWFTSDVLAVSAQGAGKGIYTVNAILRFGSRLGLDVRALSTCLDDPGVATAVKVETASGTGIGLAGGPAVIVLKGATEVARFTGTLDVTKILAAIDAAG